jgi:hypothetical protein
MMKSQEGKQSQDERSGKEDDKAGGEKTGWRDRRMGNRDGRVKRERGGVPGEIAATMTVAALPPNDSCSRRVSLESL